MTSDPAVLPLNAARWAAVYDGWDLSPRDTSHDVTPADEKRDD